MITPDWTLAVAAAIFLITLFALDRLLFRPLFEVLDQRKAKTVDLSEKTQEVLELERALALKYDERLREARQAAYRVAEAFRAEGVRERQQVAAEARTRAEVLVAQAREQIQAEIRAGESVIERDSEEIAQQITDVVLGRS